MVSSRAHIGGDIIIITIQKRWFSAQHIWPGAEITLHIGEAMSKKSTALDTSA